MSTQPTGSEGSDPSLYKSVEKQEHKGEKKIEAFKPPERGKFQGGRVVSEHSKDHPEIKEHSEKILGQKDQTSQKATKALGKEITGSVVPTKSHHAQKKAETIQKNTLSTQKAPDVPGPSPLLAQRSVPIAGQKAATSKNAGQPSITHAASAPQTTSEAKPVKPESPKATFQKLSERAENISRNIEIMDDDRNVFREKKYDSREISLGIGADVLIDGLVHPISLHDMPKASKGLKELRQIHTQLKDLQKGNPHLTSKDMGIDSQIHFIDNTINHLQARFEKQLNETESDLKRLSESAPEDLNTAFDQSFALEEYEKNPIDANDVDDPVLKKTIDGFNKLATRARSNIESNIKKLSAEQEKQEFDQTVLNEVRSPEIEGKYKTYLQRLNLDVIVSKTKSDDPQDLKDIYSALQKFKKNFNPEDGKILKAAAAAKKKGLARTAYEDVQIETAKLEAATKEKYKKLTGKTLG